MLTKFSTLDDGEFPLTLIDIKYIHFSGNEEQCVSDIFNAVEIA